MNKNRKERVGNYFTFKAMNLLIKIWCFTPN